MKQNLVSHTRWLSLYVALFGSLCAVRAYYSGYFLVRVSKSSIARYLEADAASKIGSAKTMLTLSFTTFTFAALLAFVAAAGLFLRRTWAAKIWLYASAIFLLYFLFSLWVNPSGWSNYLAGLVLCLYSWFVLWYLPRKEPELSHDSSKTG